LIAYCFLAAFVMGPIVSTLPLREYFADIGPWKYFGRNAVFLGQQLLPGVFDGNPYREVNVSLWSLQVEMLLYVLLPPLLWALRRPLPQKLALACAAVGFSAARVLGLSFFHWELAPLLTLAPYFFIGTLFNFPGLRRLLNTQAAVAALLAMAVLPSGDLESELVCVTLLPYIVFSFALPEKPLFAGLFTKNDYSYGLYLYAFPVQQLLVPALTAWGIGARAAALFAFAATLPMAALSWHLVEKRAQRLAKRVFTKKEISA